MTQPPTPAGWYPDPHNPQQQRYWDGAQWTQHISAPTTPLPAHTNVLPTGQMTPNYQRATGQAWPRRHPVWTGVIGVVVLLIVIGAATGSGSDGSTKAAGGPTPSPASSVPVITPVAPSTADVVNTPKTEPRPAAPTSVTVFDKSGNGEAQTQEFTVSDEWAIKYRYNCSAFGQTGNFQIFVYGTNNAPSFSNEGTNQLGTRGSDVVYNHHGGTYYLTVNSECAWHIIVVSDA